MLENKAVLIVDDKMENLFALKIMLKPTGLKIIKAKSGQEAIEKLRENAVDLILLDVKMPVMDGYETATTIRQNSTLCHIPIIFVSAIDEGTNSFSAEAGHGIIDYMYKPIDKQKMKDMLEKYL